MRITSFIYFQNFLHNPCSCQELRHIKALIFSDPSEERVYWRINLPFKNALSDVVLVEGTAK